ncbi:glycoside hydrolase family 15 protein [Schizophyllum fasciatum]
MAFSVALPFVVVGLAALAKSQSSTVEAYISKESPIAQAGVLAAIGPDGKNSGGAAAGVIVASPSNSNPDYLYTWTRDAALVSRVLVDEFTSGGDSSLQSVIESYVTAQDKQQHVDNPSGGFDSGGLGEPKFNKDLTAFTGAWGRPQTDGPALRALTLMEFGNYLISKDNSTYVTDTLWPIVKADLDYTVKYWDQQTFDLWEEVQSSGSFFTAVAQHAALREGATFASAVGQDAGDYGSTADKVLCSAQSYWKADEGFFNANQGGGRSGIDNNAVLASIHTFDADAGCDANTFQPCSDRALSNLKVYVDSFRGLYQINPSGEKDPILTGRYKEDSYQGGNPWYLNTFAVAEQLYDALTTWDKVGQVDVTSTSLAFFKQFSDSIAEGTYKKDSDEYSTLTKAVKDWADGFIEIIAKNTPEDGSLAEQINKDSGEPASALDLTWSYASAVSAFRARDGFVPPSWGAANVTTKC